MDNSAGMTLTMPSASAKDVEACWARYCAPMEWIDPDCRDTFLSATNRLRCLWCKRWFAAGPLASNVATHMASKRHSAATALRGQGSAEGVPEAPRPLHSSAALAERRWARLVAEFPWIDTADRAAYLAGIGRIRCVLCKSSISSGPDACNALMHAKARRHRLNVQLADAELVEFPEVRPRVVDAEPGEAGPTGAEGHGGCARVQRGQPVSMVAGAKRGRSSGAPAACNDASQGGPSQTHTRGPPAAAVTAGAEVPAMLTAQI